MGYIQIVLVVQSLSCILFFAAPRMAQQPSLHFNISQCLLKLMSVESVISSNILVLCHLLHLLPSIVPSFRVFFNESALLLRWPKYRGFSFNISPSNEYSELISFRTDWFDLLAVQGSLKSLLKHHSSKASILWHSTFFMVQLSHSYITSGKITALTRWTFVSKGPVCRVCWQNPVQVCHSFASKGQVSFNFMAAVTIYSDFRVQENKVCHCFHCFPIYLP